MDFGFDSSRESITGPNSRCGKNIPQTHPASQPVQLTFRDWSLFTLGLNAALPSALEKRLSLVPSLPYGFGTVSGLTSGMHIYITPDAYVAHMSLNQHVCMWHCQWTYPLCGCLCSCNADEKACSAPIGHLHLRAMSYATLPRPPYRVTFRCSPR